MKHKLLSLLTLSLLAGLSSSCIIQQTVEMFIRAEYPGELPPTVIVDVNGKPAHSKWLKVDLDALPVPQEMKKNREVEYAPDGTPYSFVSEYENVLVSPYDPYHQLSYKGIEPGTKVWDPYARKPFYIKRSISFN